MDNNLTAIVIQIIIFAGSLFAANRQYVANKAKSDKDAAKLEANLEKERLERKAEREELEADREVAERTRLHKLQQEIQEGVWARVKEEREEMTSQITTLRASIILLRADLDAERVKRAGLAVELAATIKELALTVKALKIADDAKKEADIENALLRKRVAKLERRLDTGPLTGDSPEK
jgi:hypothetical protein